MVDDQTSPHGNMVSNNRGFQLLKSIDPQLKWKNGRQRAARRARTLYIWSNINKWSNLNFSYNKNKDSLSIEDTLISESEKVGVSILGRRFKHTSGHTPPKKRKILVHPSFTSPHCSPSNSDDFGYAMLKGKQDSLHVKSASLLEGTEKDFCIADFSGISILADAACDSDLGFASSDVQESLKENDEIILSSKPNGNDLPMPQISEHLVGKADIPSDASCLSALHSKRLTNEVKSDESVKSFQNILCKTREFTSNRISLPWDLNTAIDESFEHETIYKESKDTIRGEINENSKQLTSQLKFREPKDLHGESKTVESREIKTHDNLKAKRDSDFSSCGSIEESKKSTTVSAVSMDAEVVSLKIDACKQAPPLIEDQNTAVFQMAKDSVLLSEFDTKEEKAEASRVPFSLEVDIKTTSPRLASSDHVITHFHSGTNNGLIGIKGSSSTDQESFHAHSSPHVKEHPESFGKHTNSDYETSMKINFDATLSAKVDTAKSDFPMRIRMDLGNHIEGHNNDIDQANGMEKLEFLSDDGSQYEDGELREPLTDCWVDGVEEDDADTVDYGSDKDKDRYNDTSEWPTIPMHTSNDVGVSDDASNTRNHILESNDGRKKPYSTNSYNKMSTWDHVPRRCTESENNVSKYHDHGYLDPSRASQAYNSSVRVKSSFCRDNDNSKDRRSRSMERSGYNPHVEKHKEGPQQRSFSYLHSYDNGRSEYRGRFSPKYHGRNRLNSSTYSHPRNAVTAKIANIQRNGFVVAPDGTIIKAKASPYRDTVGRGAPIDRERRYGMGFRNYRAASPGRPALSNVGRYSHGEDAIASSSSMHHSTRRYHAPSPSRSQFHLSSSPSRSRMHSPHRWVSPRGKNDLSSSSKSPDFVNTGPRASRPSSDFGDCAVNHGSIPHASRWIDERKDSNHYREHRFERQGNRFESVHYHGRGKQGGYTRSINNGRFHDDDDIRERHGQYPKNGYVRRQWHDDENGFLGHDSCQKSSDVQRRDGPRVLD